MRLKAVDVERPKAAEKLKTDAAEDKKLAASIDSLSEAVTRMAKELAALSARVEKLENAKPAAPVEYRFEHLHDRSGRLTTTIAKPRTN